MHAFGRLISADEARRRLLAAVRPIARTERVAVTAAFDRVSSSEIRVPFPVPAFARATWDGYAVRSRETRGARPGTPVTLRVVGELYAESRFDRSLGPGETVAVATGASLPRGADAVVIFEDVTRTGDRIRIARPAHPVDRLVLPGADFRRGERLARRGALLGAADLGAIAACGVGTVSVFARPVVAVVPNGNELVRPGTPRRPGRIFESNNATLAAAIVAAGGRPWLHRPVKDDPVALERALRSALGRADLVLATGGSSVGERDLLPRIFPRLGRLLFHGVAVRPGKPTLAARAGPKLLVGLPGHPTSCLANMMWLVTPVLRRLGRRPGPGWTEEWSRLGAGRVESSPRMTTVVPLDLRGLRAFPTFRDSARISSLRAASAFALIAPRQRALGRGDRLRVYRLAPPLAFSEPPETI
jgi:molybdenum cofactor synthesis domain-containing protein